MSTDGVNVDRRRLLIGATAAVGAVGVAGVAVPFVKSWNPSAKAKAAGAPVFADISAIEPGQRAVFEWRGKPVWVVRRTPEMLKTLTTHDGKLADPASEVESQQPTYAQNATRSIKPEYLVLTGICTHLGCSPLFRPEIAAADLGSDWVGGFFCPCHGSRFDLAGRVYNGVPAPTNLVVPPYRYESDSVIVIGEDTV
ncbi:ubiquinol-cytochrome c reductase iron-sulfur subunit [Paraperlucidibaca baekdonensis]|mgnify:FL=1|uniref:Ubiquinol-cytochrome c reductase iron-sulfur subunit n=1 Tax=Paraperlucidibaca baekdonensis TaxID=748120 RepID=A0A3E0H5S6_9GAMM|nr:ubiquinol-cytochrome c reductase iron-sulfur subunit [Paraperlucidibaca baekdonensis]REH38755.1 ubiquinol-cytochrome c reductase iron-sulfur subunit [Paraperlucidibaca baekdonensis]